MTEQLHLPARPAPQDPPGFPLAGALAPLLLAGVLFAVLRSPTVLLFALLSPVLALAGVLDGRLGARRRRRRDERRHAEALDRLEGELETLRAGQEQRLRSAHPGPEQLAHDPASWRARPPDGTVVLGSADLEVPALVTGRPESERERRLVGEGRRLRRVPVSVPAGTGVAVAGHPLLAGAFARAAAVAAARATGRAGLSEVLADPTGAAADLVVRIESPDRAVVTAASGPAAALAGRSFVPAFVTRRAYEAVLRSRAAPTAGLADLLAAGVDPGGLAACFAQGGTGEPVPVDLDASGPHAVVAGTTGSGKSALLTAWVLALAAAHPPEALSFLLVDCKGGAAFDPLAALPHVVGVVTDLDVGETDRAVASLRAELRRREASVRARPGDRPPRLVIVVDEFRALLEARPALAAVFVDLAARGRSLGVHLVLCTQRPAGSIRDELMTNCALRICLRVNDPADSRAVVGTDAAAGIGREEVGAAFLAVSGERAVRITVARLDEQEVRRTVARLAGPAAAGRPWLEALPARLPQSALPPAPPGRLVLGLLDIPDRQEQPPLVWTPSSLLVVGAPGSGRSSTLALVAGLLPAEEGSADPATAWELLHDDDLPLVLDDLEHLIDRLGPAHGPAALERLAVRLRRPGAAPTVVAVRGPSGWAGTPIRQVAGLFHDVLLLQLPLDDHLAAGGARDGWDGRLGPGGGWWRGERAQLALPSGPLPRTARRVAPLLAARPVLLVSARPAERAEQLTASGWTVVPVGAPLPAEGAVAAVGTAAAWQANWSAFTRTAAGATVLADGVDQPDLRALLGRAVHLPVVSDPDELVLVPGEGEPERVRLRPR